MTGDSMSTRCGVFHACLDLEVGDACPTSRSQPPGEARPDGGVQAAVHVRINLWLVAMTLVPTHDAQGAFCVHMVPSSGLAEDGLEEQKRAMSDLNYILTHT